MGARRALLATLALACIAVLLVLRSIDTHLVHPASPHGVVSLEFCGFVDGCAAIRTQWDARTREWAMLSLGVDALFLLLYPALLAVALVTLAARVPRGWRIAARLLSLAMLGVAAADAAENAWLVHMLMQADDAAAAASAWRAAVAATLKFAGLIAALVLVAALLVVRRRPTDPR